MGGTIRISSAPIYENGATKEGHVIDFCDARVNEIDEQIQTLQAERRMMKLIADKFRKVVCKTCDGEGSTMGFPPGYGAEDGRRLMTCSDCKGKGVRSARTQTK